MRWFAVGAVLALAGCGTSGTDTANSQPLNGVLSLSPGAFSTPQNDGTCRGKGGYDDINEGTSVVISDEHGDVIETTQLLVGIVIEGEFAPESCDFAFAVVDDIADAEFYKVEASHRGQVTYSKADLEANGWIVQLTLG